MPTAFIYSQHRHWTHSATKPTAVTYSPSTQALNSFSHEAYSSYLQSINTGTELSQPWSLQQLPSVHQHRYQIHSAMKPTAVTYSQHRHWTQPAMKPTAVTFSPSTQALNLVSHEASSSYLHSTNRHWTHPARTVTFSPSTQALNSVSPVPTESTGVLGWLPGVGCTGTESHLQETGTQLQKWKWMHIYE